MTPRKYLGVLQMLRRALPSSRVITTASRGLTVLPAHELIEEERNRGYNPKHFYPVKPGDLFNNRYKVLTKLGWGASSTVWLAQDTRKWWCQSNRYVALKIAVSDFIDEDAAKHELDISQRLVTNPSHIGFQFVRTVLDSFEATGPHGTHTCLVFESMREPIWLHQRRWKNSDTPLPLLKVYIKFLLQGLDYLHSECRIIHTDLKLDNILMGFENPFVIEDYVKTQAKPGKVKGRRSTLRSSNDFGELRPPYVTPFMKIVDFGLAQPGDGSEPLRHPIQPPAYFAPEVILGTGWTYKADIWNFGVLLWNLLEREDLFKHLRSSDGAYSVRAHLAEMIALLGPPPTELLDQEKRWSEVKWSHGVENSEGKICHTAREYYGGPFFDSDGAFKYKALIPSAVTFEDTVLSLEGNDKRLFLSFARKMLQWVPEERKTAKELVDDPWLDLEPRQ
ncbi:MAG: hypothetical protein M1837_000380 [Sclerophora amabilis]|nr:MAG: hypothetical protein M1837_000380 [Sclerophora amabilis]